MNKPKTNPDTSTYGKHLGARIRKLREKNGYTVGELTARLAKFGYPIESPTLYHWENGHRNPHLDAVPALAKALKVKIVELFPKK